MAKFSGSQAAPGQRSDLDVQSVIQTPAQQVAEQTPQSAPAAGGAFERRLAQSLEHAPAETAAATVGESVAAGLEAGLQAEAQIESERVPTISERAADTSPTQFTTPFSKEDKNTGNANGGLWNRSGAMVEAFNSGAINFGLTPTTTEGRGIAETDTASLADLEAEAQTGSLRAAFNRSGAIQYGRNPDRSWKVDINPLMLHIGSAVTENMMAEASFGDTDKDIEDIDPSQPSPTVVKAKNNAALGKQIHREFMREQNRKAGRPSDEYQDLSREEATTLGDAFKEAWLRLNPDLATRGIHNKQVTFQLTPKGVEAMKKGAYYRKRLFPKDTVRPAKAPVGTRGGQLPGEIGRTVTRQQTGRVATDISRAKVLTEAAENLNAVPNVVDKQRLRILYTTALPVISGQVQHNTWQGAINNMGPDQASEFQAKETAYHRDVAAGVKRLPYSAREEMDGQIHKIAQEIRAIAQERKGANHLTYYIQSFNGRIAPQQTAFDPTTSKAVRFVTRNAVPSPAAPGSRVARNLEQMYAMMLVPSKFSPYSETIKGEVKKVKPDALLPAGRLEAFKRAESQLEAWGDRLSELLDASMTDAQAEAVSEAIEQGIPLDDPSFPQFNGLQLDPQRDAEIIKILEDKGEDGPHWIDGVIDAAQYIKAKRDGRTHHSYFNAYVDGKTNGLASNGIQMGDEATAYATGVIRNNTERLLDEGDIRDKLADDLVNMLHEVGFDGDLGDRATELYAIAETVYQHRSLNKGTTMTFSYGKELSSFKEDVSEAIDVLAAKDNGGTFSTAVQVMDNDPKWGREKLVETLHKTYVEGLVQRLGKDAMKSRAVMRSAAIMHALTDQLFTITGPTGFDINLGASAAVGYDDAAKTSYSIFEGGERVAQPEAVHYEHRPTASAIRRRTDPKTGEVTELPGDYAYGGAVPAPIQSLDAATVAKSASGKTWEKLKAASNGNPYMHTIYDAFKLDAMGFDVAVEEINNNWLSEGMNWSYLEETAKSTEAAMRQWHNIMKQRPQTDLVDISQAGDYRFIGWILEPQETQSGKSFPTRLSNKLRNMVHAENEAQAENVANESVQRIMNRLREGGIDIYNLGDQLTVAQVRTVVDAFAKELSVGSRLSSMINSTNTKKKALAKKIRKKGNYQYYAH